MDVRGLKPLMLGLSAYLVLLLGAIAISARSISHRSP